MSFEAIYKTIQKSAKEDKDSSIHKAGDISLNGSVPYGIPSGIPRLDLSIGRPGLPAGRVIEYFGFEGSGKTTAALHAIAQAQRMGGGGLYIDAEYAWDDERAEQIGVDIDTNFLIGEVNTVEGIFRQLDSTIQGKINAGYNKPFVAVVDSITGVTTEHEDKKEYGQEARVGQDARVIRGGMKKLMKDVAKSKICLIFINHAINKIGAMAFAKQSQSAGGHAIKFYSTLRCEFAATGQIKDDKDRDLRLGQKVNINIEKLKKSRLEHPKIKDVHLLNDNGFDLTTELLEGAVQCGFVVHPKSSQSYTLQHPQVVEFSKKDWKQVVLELGGPQKAYEMMLSWATEQGILRPWTAMQYE